MREQISRHDRIILEDLAKKVQDAAESERMKERVARWYTHNSGRSREAIVVVELGGFMDEFMAPYPCQCEHPLAREIERSLRCRLVNENEVGDDKVITADYLVSLPVRFRPFNLEFSLVHARDGLGRNLGYRQVDFPVKDLLRELPRLERSVFGVDREEAERRREQIEDWIGRWLAVRLCNGTLNWALSLSRYAIHLMGDEALFVAMAESPGAVHCLYDRIGEELIAFMEWQEREELLTLNNANDYTGAGSYGFTDELPAAGWSGTVRIQDLWGNMNSQETVCVSPAMFAELAFPAYERIARRFGLLYYGCCEPVHDLWDSCLSRLSNLRKVSISPWCDERKMGARIAGTGIIYSRKPSPNYLSADRFDEEAFREHLRATFEAARACALEIIIRDVYTVRDDRKRLGRAVAIIRELADRYRS